MEIKEITPQTYGDFLKTENIPYNFMQAPAYASINNRFILGGYVDGKLTFALIVTPRKAMKLFKYAYSVQDYVASDRTHEIDFVKSAARWLKDHGYILWQMESSIEDHPYDNLGQKQPGFDNTAMIKAYEYAGFEWQDLGRGTNIIHQSTWQSVIDLKDYEHTGYIPPRSDNENYDYDAVFDRFHTAKRRDIRAGLRKGVRIVMRHPSDMSEENWQEFERLLQLAGTKHGFDSGMEEDHKQLAKALADNAWITIAYVEEGTPAAGAMFMETPNEMLYFISGSDPDKKFSKYNAPSVLQAEMIRQAVNDGLTRYNMGGISGYFEPGQEGAGVFKFKETLGAHVIHTLGVFNMPLNGRGKLFLKRLV